MVKITAEQKEHFQYFYIPMIACLLWVLILTAAMIMGAAATALGLVGIIGVSALGVACILAFRRDSDFRLLSRAKEQRTNQENRDLQGSLQEVDEMLTVSRYALFPDKLFSSLGKKFPEMSGHWEWVSCYSALIAGKLGLGDEQVEAVRQAALLMDLGMLELDDAIRTRQGEPVGNEMAMIKNHPLRSESMLARLDSDWAILPLVRSHHEWWNGWGYPDSLLKEEIPLGARIIALADAFVAMLSPRVYREARELEDVLEEIKLYRDKQFDPMVVEAFLGLMVERFDLPESEWSRLQSSETVASEAAVSIVSKWGSEENEDDRSVRENHELLEALWDINGVKRLTRVA